MYLGSNFNKFVATSTLGQAPPFGGFPVLPPGYCLSGLSKLSRPTGHPVATTLWNKLALIWYKRPSEAHLIRSITSCACLITAL